MSNELANVDIKTNKALYLLWKYFEIRRIVENDFSSNDYAQFSNLHSKCELTPLYTYLDQPIVNISLDCKLLLFSYAYGQRASPIVLGGDFSQSVFGDPSISTEVFSYIASHPWIQVLSIQDLSTQGNLFANLAPNDQGVLSAENKIAPQSYSLSNTHVTDTQAKVYASLIQSPKNQLTDLSWQLYNSLLKSGSPELLSLQGNYLGQIGEILTAANWAETPVDIHSCDLDIDYDGINECILANAQFFIVIEKTGGYIPFVFTRDAKGIHQLIGPTWEFIIGLSDPSSWDVNMGVRGDSAQILGAFQDKFYNWSTYDVNITDHKIELFEENMAMRKSITIFPDKIHIDVENIIRTQIELVVPLVVDPWLRYTTHWGESYTGVKSQSGFLWGIPMGEMVGINSTNPITIFRFNETREALSRPEDPNFDYSRGHYLPYPMALVEFSSSQSLSVDIVINP